MRLTNVRFLLKVAFLIFCLLGFTYQTTQYLIMYYKYPIDTSIIKRYPSTMELPAISVCNINPYRRTEFCKMFPNQCEQWDRNETVCKAWPHFCMDSTEPLLVPKIMEKDLNTYNASIRLQLSHTYQGLVRRCQLTVSENYTRSCDSFGPPLALLGVSEWGVSSACYTINFFWLKETKEEIIIPKTAELTLELYTEEHEYFPETYFPLFQIAVHPGNTVVNPFAVGTTFLPGRAYFLDVYMEEYHSLESPYSTDCKKYSIGWSKEYGSEPTSKQDCTAKCILMKSLEKYGCAVYTLQYPHKEVICATEREVPATVMRECSKKCRFSCYFKEYKLTFDQLPPYKETPLCRSGEKSREWCSRTLLLISFSEYFVSSYTMMGKYKSIEIFSNIGGYLGMWLGVSLLSVSDTIWPLWHCVKAKMSHRKKSEISVTKTAPMTNRRMKKSRRSQTFISVENPLFSPLQLQHNFKQCEK